jgi:hypothetical protein
MLFKILNDITVWTLLNPYNNIFSIILRSQQLLRGITVIEAKSLYLI